MPSDASPRPTISSAARTFTASASLCSAAAQPPSFCSAVLAYLPAGTVSTSAIAMRPSPASLAMSKSWPMVTLPSLDSFGAINTSRLPSRLLRLSSLSSFFLSRYSIQSRSAEANTSTGMPLSIALASAELAERLITTLMPVVLVKAASMSSSAFFIDTAAYTVTVLSCACAGRAAVRAKSSARAVHLSMAILMQTSKGFLACLGRLRAMCFGRFWHFSSNRCNAQFRELLVAPRIDSLRCEGSDAIRAKRTCRERREGVGRVKMAQSGPCCGCQLALQQTAGPLLDHLVGQREQRRRHFEAERLGGLEIDHEFEFGGLHHR